MAKYRKKPIVIDAVQWGSGVEIDGVERINCQADPLGQLGTIQTLEGVMAASPGDWIIKGVAGELYPCKPDIFAKTYELVVSA